MSLKCFVYFGWAEAARVGDASIATLLDKVLVDLAVSDRCRSVKRCIALVVLLV